MAFKKFKKIVSPLISVVIVSSSGMLAHAEQPTQPKPIQEQPGQPGQQKPIQQQPGQSEQPKNPEATEPNYEKWGRIAVDVAKLNYQGSNISDYNYKGREEITETQAKDTFELRIQNQERAFTARVIILFNPKTDSLLSMSIEEVRG